MRSLEWLLRAYSTIQLKILSYEFFKGGYEDNHIAYLADLITEGAHSIVIDGIDLSSIPTELTYDIVYISIGSFKNEINFPHPAR